MTVEEYAGGLGIVRRYEAITGRTGLDARGVAAHALHDTYAAEILQSAGRCLGVAVAEAVELLDPAVVVIGGGLWCGSTSYRQHALAAYRSRRVRRPDTSPVVTSELKADVGVLGAALFIR
jgi:predicted NBD/HSP70 family sugar kinase